MFVANRYYNSPYIAAASSNLGDALFGNPERDYTRAQTENLKQQTEQRRVLFGQALEDRDARDIAIDMMRRSGFRVDPGASGLEKAIEAWRKGFREDPADTAPPAGATAQPPPPNPLYTPQPPQFMGPLPLVTPGTGPLRPPQAGPEADIRPMPLYDPSQIQLLSQPAPRGGTENPGSGVLRPQFQTPETLARIANTGRAVAPAPPGGISRDQLETLADIFSSFTGTTPGRIETDNPGELIANLMQGYDPQTAMSMFAAMQGQRDPNEELATRGLFAELGDQFGFGRDILREDLRHRHSIAEDLNRYGPAGSRTRSGAAFDQTAAETDKAREMIQRVLGLEADDPRVREVLYKWSEYYQKTNNGGLALQLALQEDGTAEEEGDGFWGSLGSAMMQALRWNPMTGPTAQTLEYFNSRPRQNAAAPAVRDAGGDPWTKQY